MNKHVLNRLGFLVLTGVDDTRVLFKAQNLSLMFACPTHTIIYTGHPADAGDHINIKESYEDIVEQLSRALKAEK